MLGKIKYSFQGEKYFWIFLFFYLIFRVLIINTNSAEWGDSYRILRASEYLQTFIYPEDEKRPPLFSLLLLLRFGEDLVFSGRVTMILLSLFNLFLLYKLSTKIFSSLEKKIEAFKHLPLLITILFSVSPLFLYWSLRIYADNLFLTFLLISFNLYFNLLSSNKEFDKFLNILLLSFVTILSILTRFEGYLIFGSFLVSFFVLAFWQKSSFKLKHFLIYGLLTFGLIFLVSFYEKYTFYENPLFSKYVDEVESRKLTLKEVSNYTFQLIFLSGSVLGVIFLFFGSKNLVHKKYLPIYIFILLQLALSFIWYAAVPRLFLPILPFYIFLVVFGIYNFHEFVKIQKNSVYYTKIIIMSLILLLIYAVSQYILKLPFLITGFRFLGINILIGLGGILMTAIYLYKVKDMKLIFSYLLISSIIWSYSFISLEKDVYKVLNQSVMYFLSNYPKESKILTNDVSSITRFYFKERFYYSQELDSGKGVTDRVNKVHPDFLIVTNEHNPNLSFTASKYSGLELLKEFKEVVNSRTFFTQIIKVSKD